MLITAGSVGAESARAPIVPFLAKHCFDCHTGKDAEAGLDLATYSDKLEDAEVRRRWVYLYDRVAKGEMPPDDADQPDADVKAAFLQTLGDLLSRADLALREVVLRRLNRDEYENTAGDMFGIYVDLARLLPADGDGQGFDTTAATLSLSAEQMALYIEAADLVLDRVFGPATRPRAFNKTINFATTPRGAGESERKLADGIVLFSSAKHLPLYDASLPEPGLYRVAHENQSRAERPPRRDARQRGQHRRDRGAHGRLFRSPAGRGRHHRIHRSRLGKWRLFSVRDDRRFSLVERQ